MSVSFSNTDSQVLTDFSTSPQSVSVAIGVAASDRLVFVYLYNIDGASGALISAVTIGGVTATKAVGSYASNASGLPTEAVFYWALVPTGTTATLSISFAIAPSNSLDAIVYRVVGADVTTPVSASAADNSGASISITIPSGGAFLGGASAYRSSSPPSFTSWVNAALDATITNTFLSGAVAMESVTGTSSTPGSPTVQAGWFFATEPLLSGVAIQQSTGPANIDLHSRQLRY